MHRCLFSDGFRSLHMSSLCKSNPTDWDFSPTERTPQSWRAMRDGYDIVSLADERTERLSLADVEQLVQEHAEHLGPHLRNTRYITPQARLQTFVVTLCMREVPRAALLQLFSVCWLLALVSPTSSRRAQIQ